MTSQQGAVGGARGARPRLPMGWLAVTYGNKPIGLLFNDEGLRLGKHLMSAPTACGEREVSFTVDSQKPKQSS